MEFLSTLLSLIGLGQDEADRVSNRRNEAARICGEISGEVGQLIDFIDQETARLGRRCATLLPNNPEVFRECRKVLEQQREAAEELAEQVRSVSLQVSKARRLTDWDTALARLYEWRGTSTRLRPWLAGVVQRYDEILDQLDGGKTRHFTDR